MIKNFFESNRLLKWFILWTYLLCFALCLVIPFLLKLKETLIFSLVFSFSFILIIEILFIILYRFACKKPYVRVPKIPFDKIYVEPHPYLPYVYKKNFLCQKEMSVAGMYPLHTDKRYMFPQLMTNNFRHVNGLNGDRDIRVPKPDNLLRINCLGGSTTGNYIRHNGQNYSYPLELESALQKVFPQLNLEVNNCGQGGYTSAELLIKFLLDTIDTLPDVVVIYHAYNDLGPSLTNGFEADYSHARRNLGEIYYQYRLMSLIPQVPLNSWNYLINYCMFNQNIRYSLLKAVSRGNPDIKSNFSGLGTYKRNIENIIIICKAKGIKVVLSTFSQYLYKGVEKDEVYLKYFEGVKEENKIMRELSRKHDLALVDNEALIPADEKYFVDTVHFTPEGMKLMAENISRPIIDYIKTQDCVRFKKIA